MHHNIEENHGSVHAIESGMITYERRLDRIFEKWIKCTKKEKRAAISHNYKLEVTPGFSVGRWSQWSKKRSLSGGKFSVNFSYHFK